LIIFRRGYVKKSILNVGQVFKEYLETFSHLFVSTHHDVSDRARQYLHGLMQGGDRKNCERMAEIVPDSDDQALQQFLSDSKWNADAVMDAVALRAAEVFSGQEETHLLIDECGMPKKGDYSAGVSRQWLGCLGKVDNGQVGVFAALSCGERYALTHARLFVPEAWAADSDRCFRARIPEEHHVHVSKEKIALSLVERIRRLRIPFDWVVADAGYGKGPTFCMGLAEAGSRFVVDLHSDFHVYKSNPSPYLPRQKARGRMPILAKTKKKSIEVKKLANLPAESWKTITLRDGTKGPITYQYLQRRVWIWQSGSRDAHAVSLLIRRNLEGMEYKYSLTNAGEDISMERIAKAQGQRVFIERAFQDAKQNCGMGDYQVRTWAGWHHHIALALLALLFTTEYRMRNRQETPLLSTRDIEVLLAHFLPRRDVSTAEVLEALEKRHEQRAKAIEWHMQNAGKKGEERTPILTE
jgi:SRSO17 transposase